MAQTMKIENAKRRFPKYEEYPSISVTGSLRGMKNRFGWDNRYTVRIGSYYYNLRGYPGAKSYFGIED